MKTSFEEKLIASRKLNIEQVHEVMEIMTGFETRNKYRIYDENKQPIAYAAEASKGFFSSLSRVFLKHWRSFEITIFTPEREIIYRAKFPFRWIFKALYLEDAFGKQIGFVEQKFSIFSKVFDVYDAHNRVIAQIKSPLLKAWTFEFETRGRKLGTVQKKWSGVLNEFFTDKDNFIVSYAQPDLTLETKSIMLATCLMIDIVYFENNKGSGVLPSMHDN